jgi:hypothetical protein
MGYETVKNLKAEEFKRLCGVNLETFECMVELVENHEELNKKTGRPSKLSLENQVLMTLEYLREYRTYFHTFFEFKLIGDRYFCKRSILILGE